jgi:pimeloyl-ACP methyl ester carboxylesterase
MSLRFVVPLLLVSSLSGCAVTIDHTDVFANQDEHVSPTVVEIPTNVARGAVKEIDLRLGNRRYLGYRLASPKPARAVLFMPGNGYGASRALARLASAFYDESTDLYVVSYFQPAEQQPLVGEVFSMARALSEYARTTSALPKNKVVGVGHSLGGWLALSLASEGNIGCAVVVGSGTTAAATAAQLLKPRALSSALSFLANDDVALLDNERQATQVRVPTFLVASERDEVMPVSAAHAVYDKLFASTYRELYVSPSASHGGYFRDETVIKEIRTFMRTKCDASQEAPAK